MLTFLLRSFRLSLFFVLSLAVFASASPEALDAKPKITPGPLIQEIFEKAKTTDQLLTLAAFAGADAKGLRALSQDFKDRSQKKDLPQLSLRKSEVFIGAKATGLWVDPQWPLRLAYQGISWKYDAKISFQENYFSLQRFLKPVKTSWRTRMLMFPAQAEWTERDLAAIGGAAAGVGLVVASIAGIVLLAPASFAVVVPGLVAIGLVAAMDGGVQAGMTIYDRQVLKKAFAEVETADELTVICGEKSATLSLNHKNSPPTVIEFARKSTGLEVRLLDEKKNVKSSSLMDFKNPVYTQLMDCHNEEQGEALTASLKSSIQNLKQVRSEKNTEDSKSPIQKIEGAI